MVVWNEKDSRGYQIGVINKIRSISIIRYADDFVVLHKDLEVIQMCKQKIEEWLTDLSLELKPSKTRITHTLSKLGDEEPGFKFLGFNIRQFPVGNHQSGKNNGTLLGFKTIITPSKDGQKRHYRKVADVINRMQGLSQATLIKELNPIIRGWCNYYSTVVSQRTFSRMYSLVFWKLMKWGIKRHQNKGRKWVVNKYFHILGKNTWSFATRNSDTALVLRKHGDTEIKRHVKVKGKASPYDGNWVYWSTRKGENPEVSTRVAILLKKQKGKCAHCGLYFKDGDSIEVDHIIPKSKGGKNEYKNWQLLHRHCHDTKTASDGSSGNKSNCNSVKPKPPVEPDHWVWIDDMLVTTF